MARKSTEIRQEEIKTAVLSIIRNDGIKAISTKNLAKETGLSEGAIFRHFKTKRDIIMSIINDVSEQLIHKLKEISESDDDPEKRLLKYLCSTITYLTDHNGITILLFTEASQSGDKEMMEKLSCIFASQREHAGKIISDGIAQNIWSDKIPVEDITILYMGIPITHNINLVLSKNKAHIDNYCQKMLVMILKVLQK